MKVLLALVCGLLVLSLTPARAHESEFELSEGEVLSTVCSPTTGSCSLSGSSNFVSRTLSYDSTTGKFTGTISTNLCPNYAYGKFNGAQVTQPFANAQCVTQTFPSSTVSSTPAVAPLRGAVGYAIKSGVVIYGPFDAGFSTGQACSNNLGSCAAGTDVELCESKLRYECGDSNFRYQMFLDDCGAHANPYHYHADLACDYNKTASGHSDLIGLALDGRGIYGLYETTGTAPTDLDACGGHYGNVPSYTIDGVTFPAATNVYHYHTQSTAPFTLGCYGPVASLDACKSLYSACNTGYGTYFTQKGCYKNYDLDCPCFKQGSQTYNQVNATMTVSECTGGSTTTSGTSAAFAIAPSALWAAASVAASLALFAKF